MKWQQQNNNNKLIPTYRFMSRDFFAEKYDILIKAKKMEGKNTEYE